MTTATVGKHQQIILLDTDHRRALAFLAQETGDSNMSGLVRRHIEDEMRKRFGNSWRLQLDEIAPRIEIAS